MDKSTNPVYSEIYLVNYITYMYRTVPVLARSTPRGAAVAVPCRWPLGAGAGVTQLVNDLTNYICSQLFRLV